jgi:hypothetical protein
VAICAKEVQPAPEQRSTKYAVTLTLSVEGLQASVICVLEVAAAIRFTGAVGELRSADAGELGAFDDELQPSSIKSRARDDAK